MSSVMANPDSRPSYLVSSFLIPFYSTLLSCFRFSLSNTFNTFWKGVEGNGSDKEAMKMNRAIENTKDQEASNGNKGENASTPLF